jgi:membrane protease YdiL (CAAX protease family)
MGSLLTYFALTFVVTWTCWLAMWAVSAGPPSPGLPKVIFLLGVYAPGILALWFTARQEGRPGVDALLRRLIQWQVGLKWYLFALTYIAGLKLAAALVLRLVTGAWPGFGHQPWYLLLAATIGSTVLFGQAGEELGWRGYALPRLAERLGLARASILLGVIWAVWHLPFFFLPGTDTTGQSFPLYLVQVIGLSVAIAWLYARTNGSLLLTMLLHAAINNTKDIVPSYDPGATNPLALSSSRVAWVTVGLLWLTAAYFLVQMSRTRLGSLAGPSRPS